MYLLDTNIISELRKPRPHGAVVKWTDLHEPRELKLPSAVLYEIQAGAERTRRQNPEKADDLDRWIGELSSRFEIIAFGEQEARATALFLERMSPELLVDAMIAATAAVYDLTVVTRNTRDFETFPVRTLNPFLYKG